MRVLNSICVLYKVKYQITFVRQSNRTFESRNTILHANFICCYIEIISRIWQGTVSTFSFSVLLKLWRFAW